MRSAIIFVALLVAPLFATAAAGDLDPSFGSGGVVSYAFSGRSARTSFVALGPDGRIVDLRRLDEALDDSATIMGEVGVARFLPDGSLDPAFGGQGTVVSSLHDDPAATIGASKHLNPMALAVQADGKILVGGSGTALRSGVLTAGPTLMRFNVDGTLDSGFGAGGRVVLAESPMGAGGITALAVEPGGRILAAGSLLTSGNFAQGFLAAVGANGVPDPGFASGGITVRPGTPNTMQSIARLPDGRILVGGFESNRLSARRFMPDGSPDASFAGGGWTEFFTDRPIRQTGIIGLSDGKVAMTGYVDRSGPGVRQPYRAAIALVGESGGTVPGGALREFFTGALPRNTFSDTVDRIHFAGLFQPNAGSNSGFVIRMLPGGQLDPAYSGDGVAYYPVENTNFGFGWGALQPDGSVVVTGGTTPTLLRYRGDLFASPADADGDGIPNAVEASVGRDRAAKDNDIFTEARLFAMQQYRDFLGREGDDGGVGFWATQLSNGSQNRAQMVETFFNSAEFQGVSAPVARLYFAYFLRFPDYAGLQYWIGQYGTGSPLQSISNAFATSPEFVNAYGALDNAGFVDRVYRNVLGRAPDPVGIAYWKGQLDGGMTRGQVMLGFSESSEYRALIGNEVYVTMTYVGMLRRSPDPGGFSFWVGYMDAGNSGLALINGFLAAAEYRARFLP